MDTWLELKNHNGNEVWVNFSTVAYFREVLREGKFHCTEITFCAKGQYGLDFAVGNRMDEIKTKLKLAYDRQRSET